MSNYVSLTPESAEPPPGSIVMTHGIEGTAWQRHYSDGMWHSTTKMGPIGWDQWVKRQPNLVLIHLGTTGEGK